MALTLNKTLKNSDPVSSVCVSGSRLFSGTSPHGKKDGEIKVWGVTGALVRKLEIKTDDRTSNWVYSMCASSDQLISGNTLGVEVWNLNTWEVRRLKGHLGGVRSVCVSGSLLFSGGYDETIKVWEVATGKCVHTMEDRGEVTSLCVSTDGSLFSGGFPCITVWKKDEENGWGFSYKMKHKNQVHSLCLSADESLLFSGSADETIKVWNVKNTGECVRTLVGHTSAVLSVCLSGSRLFSGSADKTIKVWNLTSGECVQTLEGHSGGVRSVCVSGSLLFSGSYDRTIKVWEMPSAAIHELGTSISYRF